MATSEGIPSSIDIEFLELNDNPYFRLLRIFIRFYLWSQPCPIHWAARPLVFAAHELNGHSIDLKYK